MQIVPKFNLTKLPAFWNRKAIIKKYLPGNYRCYKLNDARLCCNATTWDSHGFIYLYAVVNILILLFNKVGVTSHIKFAYKFTALLTSTMDMNYGHENMKLLLIHLHN